MKVHMKFQVIILCIALGAIAHMNCGRTDFAAELAGKWQWTGDACDTSASCQKEIMTDEGSGDTFTRDGFYVTQRSRNGYSLAGRTLRFASARNLCGTIEAEIVSLAGDDLLLRCGSTIRRFTRVRTR
jgi:hypothetical protein